MGLSERNELYRKLEQKRKRPVIVYVTSTRPNAEGQIAGDAVHEFELQLQAIPLDTDALDLLIVSNGGDPTVAWRVVSLIRERVKQLSALVPAGAFSAATLIALGANSIVIHANGNLGPVDPQIHAPKRGVRDGQREDIQFSSEDLSAFLTFTRETVGLTDQQFLWHAFNKFCDEVGAVPIGGAARGSQLILSMAEKLLRMHMLKGGQEQRAKTIAEKLSREFYHHGYALSRSEAREIGLPVEKSDADVDDLIWRIWLDFVADLETRGAVPSACACSRGSAMRAAVQPRSELRNSARDTTPSRTGHPEPSCTTGCGLCSADPLHLGPGMHRKPPRRVTFRDGRGGFCCKTAQFSAKIQRGSVPINLEECRTGEHRRKCRITEYPRMARLTDRNERGFGMIVRTTAPDSDAPYWADFSPHRVRTTSAPTQRTYVVSPEPTRDEVVLPQPAELPPAEPQGDQAPAQPTEQH